MIDEYGIAKDTSPEVLHRGPMTLSEAEEWIREWDEMSSLKTRKGMFIIISRSVSPWGPV